MADRPDDDLPAGYASPPCFMHELDPAWLGLPAAPEDAQQRRDVARWRKAERQRLIAARMALDPSLRRHWCDRIAAHLDASLGPLDGLTVSGWWPIRAEPDLRTWADTLPDRGASYALPVVAEKGRPLVFRRWRRGDRLEPGVWNIPTPVDGPEVVPDIVLAPIVGFDRACWRLGYGGGYFDRTLAVLPAGRTVVGVGFSLFAIPTIYPQPHDIPMGMIVTEEGRRSEYLNR
ncbi:5,10-methenyltetrahydrofolate synthetase [Stella humosa]|uniref:5-formyltetrahydrofolate cyclo-ligase n=1 Tax=Stella humosa TaxID=94 RepID=A0A3N1KZG0_9PROT|nr:5-formyltetrahydrofolate cyclo-ligase [Stella humosa]ROP83586.1 5,10-methenyltetrahydrofolate synthetase [Stella humosa]BBK33142.1 5-formyltetrahydrofolate cyclo-ligase [Stella humosa]